MLTRKQAAEQRRALKRDIDREHKKKARAKVAELRSKLREQYAHKKVRLKEISERCRSERLTVRDRLREVRARVLGELRETARLEREAARSACMLRKKEAKDTCATSIGRARAELEAERQYQADLRRIESGNRARHVAHKHAAARAERRGESDDEVRQNIPHELVELFEKVKRSIKGSSRMSRTEAFLKYAEEHPHEVFSVIDDKTERVIRELERKHAEVARVMRRPSLARVPPRVPRRTYSPEELAAVPF